MMALDFADSDPGSPGGASLCQLAGLTSLSRTRGPLTGTASGHWQAKSGLLLGQKARP
jgi:hypothetical protein